MSRLRRHTGLFGQFILPTNFDHSIFAEPDYVCPAFSAALGVFREFDVVFSGLGLGFSEPDPRISDDEHEAQCGHHSVAALPVGVTHVAEGASQHMDSWLGVEPCDLVGTGMVESSSRVVQRAEPAGEPLGNAVCTQGESHVQSVHSVVRPCGFGVRHNACESADRRRRHMRRKVAFSPAVQFWFPAPDQLCLPPAGVPLSPSSNPSGAPTGFKGSGHVGFRPPSCYLHESALLSPACPDGSGHVGLRPPAAAIKEYLSERVRTVPPVPALVDGAAWNHQRLALVGRLSSRCDSPVLGLAGEFRSLCLPQPSSQAECMVYPLPVSLFPGAPPALFLALPHLQLPP